MAIVPDFHDDSCECVSCCRGDGGYQHLGYFSACEPWAAQHMQCDDCMVSWTGCWDNFECPKCGCGELPSVEDIDALV